MDLLVFLMKQTVGVLGGGLRNQLESCIKCGFDWPSGSQILGLRRCSRIENKPSIADASCLAPFRNASCKFNKEISNE